MNKNQIQSNILCQEMKLASTPGEAWYNGTQYFLAAEAEAYKVLDKEQLTALLQSAITLQKETGLICIYEDPTMPADARVDIIYKPSYAITSIAIYACLHYPEIFSEEISRFFSKLLEGTFCYGIIGHGIESEETVRRTLLMLCKAGLRQFLSKHHKEHLVFAHAIQKHITHFEELCERIDAENLIVTANGFSPDSINHLIKELIAYWNYQTHPVFVYGTLMKGERANWMLRNGEYAGRFLLRNYAMYNIGSYPGIKPNNNESVIGELYYVTDETLGNLDRYENKGTLYDRVLVNINAGSNSFSAWAYVYIPDVFGCTLMREMWGASDNDLVWYAGYGSNLSSNRFACYISGGYCVENGKHYEGSSDPTPPRAIKKKAYHGSIYFGNQSASWNNSGVAFYNPQANSASGHVYMKLYQITRRQLHDVMYQEGSSPNWYGRLICLEVDDKGIPVYTLSSESKRPLNSPDSVYKALITGVLSKEFGLSQSQLANYFENI